MKPYASHGESSISSANNPLVSHNTTSQSSYLTSSYTEPSHLRSSDTSPYNRSTTYPYNAPTNLFQDRVQRPCQVCDEPLTSHHVRTNRNGHLGRRFFRCDKCGDFRGWAEDWGVYQQNPRCRCGQFSRLDRAGPDKGYIHFYKCASGNCGFYTERNWQIDSGGRGGALAEMEGW